MPEVGSTTDDGRSGVVWRGVVWCEGRRGFESDDGEGRASVGGWTIEKQKRCSRIRGCIELVSAGD